MRLEKLQLICGIKDKNTGIRKKMAAEALTGSTEVLCIMCGNFPNPVQRAM